MAEEKQIFHIDLDAKNFIHNAQEAKKVLGELGEVENISGLIEGFATMGVSLGVVATALLTLKKGFDLTLEAEQINRVSTQFDLLATNAGLVPSVLREGLEKSTAGFMTMNDALKSANKAIVELGVNANRIPEIMELARKVTTVFGGDLASNFDRISMAMASGNVRMLKHMGIVIDSDKALRDYANSVNKMVSDLSEQDKKTAILNATMEKGKTSLKGAKEDVNSLTVSYQKLKVGINEIFEFVIVKYEQMFGSNFRTMISMASGAIKNLGNTLTANYGSGIERTRAQAEKLREQIKSQTEEVSKAERMYTKYGSTVNGIYNNYKGTYENAKKALADSKSELEKYDKYLEKREEQDKERAKNAEKKEKGPDKREAETKFNQDILKLKEARIQAEIALETDADEMKKHRAEELVNLELETNNKIREADEKALKEGGPAIALAEQEKFEIKRKYALDVQKLIEDSKGDEIKAANQAAKVSANTSSGFSKGWKAAALDASKDVGNFAKLGDVAFKSLKTNAKSAFIALGDGSKNAAEAMRGFMLNSIADIAEAQGSELLATGIGTFQPEVIAQGGALLALSGMLRSAAGGGGGGIGASTGGGGGGASASSEAPSTVGDLQTAEAAKTQKSVTIAVQGNYFETEQTKRTLMEMIRSETDATSFSYVQINQGGAS